MLRKYAKNFRGYYVSVNGELENLSFFLKSFFKLHCHAKLFFRDDTIIKTIVCTYLIDKCIFK